MKRRDADACRQALAGRLRPELFRALSDPTRIALLVRLAAAPRPLTVTELRSGRLHLSGASRHLALLRRAGIVRAERHGREVRHAIDCEALTAALRGLADAIDDCRAACCGGDR